jgi:hypothetical protein
MMINRKSLILFLTLPFCLANVFGQSRATVVFEGVRLREKPSSRSTVMAQIDKGAELQVKDAFLDEDWTLVAVRDKVGWIRRDRIRIRMDDPWKHAAWLYMGRTPETNGFIVRFYLNATQIIRRGNDIRFWTKMVPNNKPAYFDFVMDAQPARQPADFRFNTDLWEGDCSSHDIDLVRSLFYWRNNEMTRPQISRKDVNTSSDSAARAILIEACKAADNMAP